MELITFENTERVLREYGEALRDRYKDNLSEGDARVSGKLIDTVETIVDIDGNKITLSLSLQEYYKYIEYGTKPFWPPKNKILEWIVKKPVLPKPMKNGKLPRNEQLAFLISRKISKYGIEPHHYLNNAEASLYDEWMDKIKEALDADIDRSVAFVLMQLGR